MLKNTFGIDRVGSIEAEVCATCGDLIEADGFTDELSRKEYKISGMCQNCQNSVFN